MESRFLLQDINSLINVMFLFMFQTDSCRVFISYHNDFVDTMDIECSLEKKEMIIVSAFAKKKKTKRNLEVDSYIKQTQHLNVLRTKKSNLIASYNIIFLSRCQ